MSAKINLLKSGIPEKAESLILFVFEKDFKNLEKLPLVVQKKAKEKVKKHDFKGGRGESLTLENTDRYELLIIIGLGKKDDFNLNKFKNSLAKGLRKTTSKKIDSSVICYFKELGTDYFEIGKNLSLALTLSNYRFNKYKSKEERKKDTVISSLNFHSGNADLEKLQAGINWGELVADGVYLTRDLVNEPAAQITPQAMVNVALEIAKESRGRIKVEVLNEAQCSKLGMGAFLGVAQGSEHEAKFIILHYSSAGKKICLVGKTITFDSGGLSIKPSESMEDMKIDMAGGATVLGVFKILAGAKNKFNVNLWGILPACENMPSGRAMRPGDIVRTLSGKTVEVLNTDAEGRLALSDALSYAEKYIKPNLMIDIATLTGACMVALGDDIAGLFGNKKKLTSDFRKIAEKEGDDLWELPLYKPYLKRMKSQVADLKNISGGRYGGAITAALFLSEFVKKAKWLHIDIAGPAHRTQEPKGVIPRGGTGWGVTSLVEFLRTY